MDIQNPFLRGLLTSQAAGERSTANQIGALSGLLSIDNAMRERGEQQALRGAVVMGPNGQLDAQETLANLYRINPITGLKFQQALQKESQFGKVDPKDYTPESINKFSTTRNYSDLVPVRKSEYLSTGTHLQPVNPYTNQLTGMPIPIGVSPNTQATLTQGQQQFNQTFPLQQQNAGINATRLFYETGMGPMGVPGGNLLPPPMAPQSAPAPSPQAPIAPAGGWQIPPAEQARRDADARRIVQAEQSGGAGMIPTRNVIPDANIPPQVFVQPGTRMGPQPRPAGPALPPKLQAEAAAKLAEAQPKEQINTESAVQKAGLVADKVDKALSTIDRQFQLPTTGAAGKALSFIPGTAAYDIDKTIDTIRANIGFQELNAMRAASPTGGALGQVTERELNFLQAAIASLDQGQSREQLVENLRSVRTHFNNWRNAMVESYQGKFGADAPLRNAPQRRASDSPQSGWSIRPVQ